jgi:RNA polymerase sigma-70 factor (family 1)
MSNGSRTYMESDSGDAFAGLYNDYRLRLIRVAYYYFNCHSFAEDVVADVFARLWERRESLAGISDIKSYLFRMVRNKCLDEINKISFKGHQALENDLPQIFINFKNPETTYLNNELAEKIKISLQKLPIKCRTVFLMVKEDHLRYKEVAELLNISEKTVEMHVGNALKALRNDLETYVKPYKKMKNRPFDRFLSMVFIFF